MAHLVRPVLIRYYKDGKRVLKGTPGAVRKKEKARKWYGANIPGEKRKRVPLATDKKAAQAMLLEKIKGHERTAAGIIDHTSPHAKRPLSEHLADFEKNLGTKARKASPKQIRQATARIRSILDACRFTYISDISAEAVEEYLAGLRQAGKTIALDPEKELYTREELAAALDIKTGALRALVLRHQLPAVGQGRARRFPKETAEALASRLSRGMSIQTSNHYLAAIKSFCRWLVKSRRAGENPLDHLSGGNVEEDRRHDRRTLEEGELSRLLASAQASERTFRGLTGTDRHAIYVVACVTGYRALELARLTPRSFSLDGSPATATVPSGYTKNRKLAVQPLPAEVVDFLRGYLKGKPPRQPVWAGSWHEDAAEMLRIDLEAAGVPYTVEGPDGLLYADFHALRHTYVALLEQTGATLKQAMHLARHSDPRLTMSRYGKPQLQELADTVQKMPSLLGTDGAPPLSPEQVATLAAVLRTVLGFLLAPSSPELVALWVALSRGIEGEGLGAIERRERPRLFTG